MTEDRNSQHDILIRGLLEDLQSAGLQTDWSCQGTPGHMTIRPTIQCRSGARSRGDSSSLNQDRYRIETVMAKRGIATYWLSLNYAFGNVDSHGGEPVWLIQIPGRFDFLALPAALSEKYQTPEDLMPEYEERPL